MSFFIAADRLSESDVLGVFSFVFIIGDDSNYYSTLQFFFYVMPNFHHGEKIED